MEATELFLALDLMEDNINVSLLDEAELNHQDIEVVAVDTFVDYINKNAPF